MIVQNNGKRRYLIDGLIIEPHKTYNITEEQYNRVKGFNEIKPLCVINPRKSDDKKSTDKSKDKTNAKSDDKKSTDKSKDKQATNTADNEQQPSNNK